VLTAIGFADAHTADNRVKMATDAAILTKLMALLAFTCPRPPAERDLIAATA
jgi:hypothetical protein